MTKEPQVPHLYNAVGTNDLEYTSGVSENKTFLVYIENLLIRQYDSTGISPPSL